jgi:hypothetical protein
MQELSKIKLWRAEEFVKLFLLKYEGDFNIEETTSRGNLFDFYLHFKGKPKYRFAIEVKHTDKFNQKLNYQLKQLVKLRKENQIDIPAILFRVNDEMEYGEIDFLIIPSIREGRLLVRETFKFVEMNNLNFKEKLETIKKWYKIK